MDERQCARARYGLSVLVRSYSETRGRRTDTGCRLEIDSCRVESRGRSLMRRGWPDAR